MRPGSAIRGTEKSNPPALKATSSPVWTSAASRGRAPLSTHTPTAVSITPIPTSATVTHGAGRPGTPATIDRWLPSAPRILHHRPSYHHTTATAARAAIMGYRSCGPWRVVPADPQTQPLRDHRCQSGAGLRAGEQLREHGLRGCPGETFFTEHAQRPVNQPILGVGHHHEPPSYLSDRSREISDPAWSEIARTLRPARTCRSLGSFCVPVEPLSDAHGRALRDETRSAVAASAALAGVGVRHLGRRHRHAVSSDLVLDGRVGRPGGATKLVLPGMIFGAERPVGRGNATDSNGRGAP